MDITVSEACRLLEAQGALRRLPKGQSEGIPQQVRELLGGQMPADLEALYRERVASVGDFAAILPKWNERPDGGARAPSEHCCPRRRSRFSPTEAGASTAWTWLQAIKGRRSTSLITRTFLRGRIGRQDHRLDASCCSSGNTTKQSRRAAPRAGSCPSIRTLISVPGRHRYGEPGEQRARCE